MLNPTKYCKLDIVMKSGARLRGKYHVPLGTDDTTRPADSLRKDKNSFILLCDVSFLEESASVEQQAVLVRADAIAYIGLPEPRWDVQDIDPASDANMRPASNSSAYLA